MKKIIKLYIQKIKHKLKGSKSVIKSAYPINTIIGRYVVIDKDVIINEQLTLIDDGTYICSNTYIDNCKSIGKYCSIGRDVSIGVGTHPIDWITTSPLFYSKQRGLVNETIYNHNNMNSPTIIGNDVWIGTKAIIMSGVTIGDGAIIAAGAVVTKNVKAYEIVAGVPAKRLKDRFSDNIIKEMINFKIATLKIDEVNAICDKVNKPIEFIEYIKNQI